MSCSDHFSSPTGAEQLAAGEFGAGQVDDALLERQRVVLLLVLPGPPGEVG
ncbi:hypothetical protein [Streptomyces sp. NPDC000133]|uniref:hypothetical protein n=1 Tax=Streptomyces sp. NPDC000133 TaxID=3364535 RepID=UPI00367F3F11